MAKDNKKRNINEKVNVHKKITSPKVRVKSATTNCSKCNKPFSYNPDDGEAPKLCKACYKQQHAVAHHDICKECGKEFYVTVGEAEFLKGRGLDLPRRCYECRIARRVAKHNSRQVGQSNEAVR